MRASFKFDQKKGNSGEEDQIDSESKMQISRSVNNRPSSAVDVEKGEAYQTEAPVLLEHLITPPEVEDQGHASHSKPLIVSEKIIVTLLVVCFVVVEAYFVGVSFRDWLDQHKHGGNSTTVLLAHDVELFVPQFLQGYQSQADSRGQVEATDPEPFEDFEGGITFQATRVSRDGLRDNKLRPDGKEESSDRVILRSGASILEDTAIRDSPNFGP